MTPVTGLITTVFTEPRPLSNPGEHIHGAVDISAQLGSSIFAPEDGTVFAWAAFRVAPKSYWPTMPVINIGTTSFCNYFYDTFGGVLVLTSTNHKRTHVITHSYGNQLFNASVFQDIRYYEEKADSRFPMHAFYTSPAECKEGALIGAVGNAGHSTGPHIHYEIHNGRRWQRWEDRIDPEKWGEL